MKFYSCLLYVCSCALFFCSISSQVLWAQSTSISPLIDGSGQWRTLQTQNFNIHFPRGQEEYTHRAAKLFERVHAKLAPLYPKPFKEYKTNVAMVFSGDVTQGLATTLGINQIILYMEPPPLGNFSSYESWLELLFTHEYTHVLSLQIWEPSKLRLFLIRLVLGIPPNLLAPRALTEGVAVWEESQGNYGRLNDNISRMIVRTAVLANSYPSLSEILNTSHRWPRGQISYLYGARLIDELARQRGKQAPRDYWGLNSLPFAIDAHLAHFSTNITQIYHNVLERDQTDFQKEAAFLESKGLTPYERLSFDGGTKSFLMVNDQGELLYFANPPSEKSGVFSRLSDGSTSHIRRQISNRGIAWAGKRRIYSSDYFLYPNFGIRQELYDGNRSYLFGRMAPKRSISYPSLNANGQDLYFIEKDASYRYLKKMSLISGKEEVLVKMPVMSLLQYTAVSPDGKYVAALLRPADTDPFHLLLCDIQQEQEQKCRTILQSRAIISQLCFSHDSQRLIFSSDVDGVYNLYAYTVQSKALASKDESGGPTGTRDVTDKQEIVRLTRTSGGFFYPASSKNALYAIGYFSDGFDIVRFSPDSLLKEKINASLFDARVADDEQSPDLQSPLPSLDSDDKQAETEHLHHGFRESSYVALWHMTPYYTGLVDAGKTFGYNMNLLGGVEARDPLNWHIIGASLGILTKSADPAEKLEKEGSIKKEDKQNFPAEAYYVYNRYNLGLALGHVRDFGAFVGASARKPETIETSEAYFKYNSLSRYLALQILLGYQYQEIFTDQINPNQLEATWPNSGRQFYLSGPAFSIRTGDTQFFYRSISPELGWRFLLQGAYYTDNHSTVTRYTNAKRSYSQPVNYGYGEGGFAFYLPSFFENHVNYLSTYGYAYLGSDLDLAKRYHFHRNLARNLDTKITSQPAFVLYTYEYRFPVFWYSQAILSNSFSWRYLSLALFYDYGITYNYSPLEEEYHTWAYGLRFGFGFNLLYAALPELQLSISNGKNSETLYSFGISAAFGERSTSHRHGYSSSPDLAPYRPASPYNRKQKGYFRNRGLGGYLE